MEGFEDTLHDSPGYIFRKFDFFPSSRTETLIVGSATFGDTSPAHELQQRNVIKEFHDDIMVIISLHILLEPDDVGMADALHDVNLRLQVQLPLQTVDFQFGVNFGRILLPFVGLTELHYGVVTSAQDCPKFVTTELRAIAIDFLLRLDTIEPFVELLIDASFSVLADLTPCNGYFGQDLPALVRTQL